MIYALHHHLISQQIVDVDGDLGPPGEVYSSRGLPLCMTSLDRIWNTRPSVDGKFAAYIVSILKPGNVVVSSAGSIPALATSEEGKKPGFLSRAAARLMPSRSE